MGKLENKVAIVTGGGAGIGAGCVDVLAKEGARVAIVDWDVSTGEKVAAELNAAGKDVAFFRCDVSDAAAVEQTIDAILGRFGALHILVNNAGVGTYKSVLDASVEDWDRCMAINLRGVFLFSKAAIPHIRVAGGGAIINMSSVHSHATVRGVAPYAASKGAITALTRNMALDYGPEIRVNSVAPGWVLTPLIQGIFESSGDADAMHRKVAERQVLKRIGMPEDIGQAVAFLASDEASFITGTELKVDGGLTALLEDWS